MDKQREGFEKAYEPNPNKSPFTEVKFDEVARVYKPLDQFNPRIASSLNAAWYGWRIRQAEVDGLQAKVEELQKQLSEYIFVAETIDEMYVKEVQKSDELQTRVDKAIRLLVEAELYQSEPNIDLAVKALKGDQYDEHRKKAEEAISKGASLTNHRIEL